MRYLSICSGIEAATVAWHSLGWTPVAFSEIEPYPCQLLAHHYPGVPNWGDLTQWRNWPDADIDLLIGGTPCQSFSVAGQRGGMDDARGQLSLAYAGIAGRYRPQWIVWENVPGVLSSNAGRDFGLFIRSLAELGYSLAYRVLDAQYVRVDGLGRAVPQRRRRVFVVGYRGDSSCAAAVLFEPASSLGNTAPCRKTWQEVAGTLASRTSAGGGLGTDFDLAGGLQPCFWNGEQVTQTLDAVLQKGQTMPEKNRFPAVLVPQVTTATSLAVRRLTPLECERLQGFPDGYTRIPVRTYAKRTVTKSRPADYWEPNADGTWTLMAADGPRYKALGNSMAVNCMRWIGRRIDLLQNSLLTPPENDDTIPASV